MQQKNGTHKNKVIAEWCVTTGQLQHTQNLAGEVSEYLLVIKWQAHGNDCLMAN